MLKLGAITLTLDISTNTGWTLLQDHVVSESGTIGLACEKELQQQRKEGKERTQDMRFSRLYQFLIKKVTSHNIQRIVFEDVLFSSTQMQGQLWASLRSTIWAIAEIYNLEVFCVPVSTLKNFATGNGLAKKPEMAQALSQFYAGSSVETTGDKAYLRYADGSLHDDNEVDAIWLARYTTTVDQGLRDFLGVYQRKQAEKAAKRAKKAAKKAALKAKALIK